MNVAQLRQLVALLQMSLRGIPQRLGLSSVTVIGSTCVVAVLVAMLSMGAGVRAIGESYARPEVAVIMSKGAESQLASNLSASAVQAVMDSAGIRKDPDGKPLATALTVVLAEAHRRSDNVLVNFGLVGADAEFFKVYPQLHLTAGRMFRPGVYELIVSRTRQQLYKGLDIGNRLHLRGVDWTVVGMFDAPEGAGEALIGDADTVKAVYRMSTVQSINAVLESPAEFDRFRTALLANPNVDADVRHELEVVRRSTKGLTGLMDFVSYFVGTVMAIGATLGAVNVMYSVVDSRRREMATLRALGFRTLPIVASVLAESLLLTLCGSALGVFAAWLFFNGTVVSPFGLSFHLAVTPVLAVLGLVWAVVMGLLGGIAPAVRAARIPVADALRAS